MLETLVNLDRGLFLLINGNYSTFMDSVMFWAADRFIWIPLYVIMAFCLVKMHGRQAYFMILFVVILILISDQSSVLVKNICERARPCHDESLSFIVHTVRNKCGGLYGFVSSHAANTMGLFVYFSLLTRNRFRALTWVLIFWVGIVGYCRVYMGAHFPADIAGGWIIGIIAAGITYIVYRLIFDSPLSSQKIE